MIESSIKQIPFAQEAVYAKLSDLNNLDALKDNMPKDKIQDLWYNADAVGCTLPMVGKVALKVVQREPCKCIKLQTEQSAYNMTLWIQIVSTGQDSCKIRISLKHELGIMMAKMVEKPLREAVDKLADALASIQY